MTVVYLGGDDDIAEEEGTTRLSLAGFCIDHSFLFGEKNGN